MEHRHAIIVICDKSGNYLQYYEKKWDSFLFLNCKIEDEDDTTKVENEVFNKLKVNTINIKYVFSKIHTKFSVKDKCDKEYHHYFYRVMVDLDKFKDREFNINGVDFKWFSNDELLNDKRIMEVNSDIVEYLKYIGINIRLAIEEDCGSLSILKQRVWSETYQGIYSDERINNYDYDKNREKFKNIILSEDVSLYVVENDSEIIGYMSVGVPVRKYSNYEQEIGLLYLRKDYQGLGIGKRLFKLACKIIKDNNYKEFFVSCNKYNLGAREFYLKMGGELVDENPDSCEKHLVQVKYHYDIK